MIEYMIQKIISERNSNGTFSGVISIILIIPKSIKKFLFLFVSIIFIVVFSGCGQGNNENNVQKDWDTFISDNKGKTDVINSAPEVNESGNYINSDADDQSDNNPNDSNENIATDYDKIYQSFMQSKQWAIGYDAQGDMTDGAYLPPITAYKIFDFDGNGVPELWMEAISNDSTPRPFGVSAIYTIDGTQVKKLLFGYQCGGTLGGDFIRMYYDTLTSMHVISLDGYAGGFGGNSGWSEFYTYENGTLSKIVKIYAVSYWSAEASEKGMGDFYEVDDTDVSRTAYDMVKTRFIGPIDSKYTCLHDGDAVTNNK